LTLPQGNVSTLYLLGESELITGDSIGYLKVWNIQSAEALTSVKVHEGAVTSLQADATKAVSCGLDMLIHITDIIQGSVLQTLRGHDSPIFAVAFDQRQIVSVSSDGEIRFWSWGR
jgi:WD40 repeat protein